MYSKLAVFARHRLDVSMRDITFGLRACTQRTLREDATEAVVQACSSEDNGLVCLSVRTGFDLLLRELKWPAGEEVIVSAITHPDMIYIIQAHGLRPVPVDIDPKTLTPCPNSLEAALTSRTRAVLVAHLFGGKMDLDSVSRFVREHNLLLFEDCAQAFQGPDNLGNTPSDVSMYSFGPLKTATAFGGAMLLVNDTKLLRKMRSTEQRYPLQGRGAYALKLLKYLVLALISRPIPYSLIVHTSRAFHRDLNDLLAFVTRSFPSASRSQLLRRIRRRPCVPLLSLLNRRLRDFDYERLAQRVAVGEKATRLLEPHIMLPGRGSQRRTYWIFPVVPICPETLVRALESHGFDASCATSNLVAVEDSSGHMFPREATRMMSSIVYLPVYPELPERALDLLVAVVAETTNPEKLQPVIR